MWYGHSEHVRGKGWRKTRRWSTSLTAELLSLSDLRLYTQIDMSNILDQAQKIIEANGFKDST